MAKVSLRDHGRAITGSVPALYLTRIEREQMIVGLKLQTLESISNVALSSDLSTKKYRRIEVLLEGLGRDLIRIQQTPSRDE